MEETIMDNILGERLRKLRNEKGRTLEEVGKIFGLTKFQMSRYEKGAANPDPDVIARLANYYGVTSDYLLGLVDNPQAIDPTIQESFDDPQTTLLFKDWQGMDEEQKAEVLEIMKYVKFKNKEKDER